MTKGVNAREIILSVLMETTMQKGYSHIVIRNVLQKYQFLDKKDRAFINRVSEGTVENLIQIDFIINQFSSVPVTKMKPVIRNILRLSVYQLKFMDHVPASAICNEAVKLAQMKGFSNLKSFVNGVLRNIARNLETVHYPDESVDEVMFLSVMYSMPEWIIQHWLKSYPYMTVKAMLESFQTKKETSIHVNTNKISTDDLITLLEADQITAKKSKYLPYALKITDYDYLNSVQSFQKGYFYVQDVSSMLVAEIASPQKGAYCIDVCAAPGGKSMHLAQILKEDGHIEARDISEYKVNMIKENVERMGLNNISIEIQDALSLDENSLNKADVLIADLPCSGLGVIGKKSDIKYNLNPDKLKELVKLQREILSVVHKYVKTGGVLVYSTCTINEDENLGNVKWLLENFPFELESIDPFIDNELQSETTKEGYLQLLPGTHDTDGFFMARLRKVK